MEDSVSKNKPWQNPANRTEWFHSKGWFINTSLFAFFYPPKISSYEHQQRAELLHYMLLAVFVGGLASGILMYAAGWIHNAIILFLLAFVCLVSFYLNVTQRSNMAGWIFCISFYVISSLLLSEGIGLFDATILTFPILMICAAFLFDTRGLLVATMASILTVFTVYAFQVRGLFQSIDWVSLLRTVVVCLLFAVTAIVIWIVRTTWAKTITLLNESYDLTLRGWARALELRDGETAGHSQRVTQLSVAVAEALGLEMEDVTNIRRGAYLHDIGKMAIPDPVLLKPGPLTKEEWEVMKQHPMRAREFLLEIPFLRGVIPIVYSHHERWDGTGYPEGLQGEKIPLLARIFAVVDNWDALTSDRPYRKAWSEEKAAAFLKENSGKVFDPSVVDVFLSVILKKN